METFFIALMGAIIGAIIGPIIVLRIKWTTEKRHEAFNIAIRAMSAYERDVLDSDLQDQERKKTRPRPVAMRTDTVGLMAKARHFVQAYFSKETYKLYDEAMKAKASIDDMSDFYDKSKKAVDAMARELITKSIWLRNIR